jgi:hypothetical protein
MALERRLRELAKDERFHEHSEQPQSEQEDRTVDRDRALRVVEQRLGHMKPEAADRLDALLRRNDPRNVGARYVTAVGSEHYASAFAKLIQDPTRPEPWPSEVLAAGGRGRAGRLAGAG